jgi:outer membrane protein assembly factor BamC
MKFKCLLLLSIMFASGCSSVGSLLDSDSSIDYKSSKTAQKLEIPPDLTQLRSTDRYTSARTASALNPVAQGGGNQVLPQSNKARIERLGNSRYLVVDLPAEQVFPIVTDFWKNAGFTLSIESPQTGVIETDWAENRAKLPQNGIRKFLDILFDTGERDQYRTRLERVGKTTEIYLTHRGTKEVASGSKIDTSVTTVRRDGSVELESEFLRRLLVSFGAEENAAKAAVASGIIIAPDRARMVAAKNLLEIDDTYDTAWRRVGLALDRTGFTIDDRNFSTGEYFIRYARDLNVNKPGFFDNMFSSEKKDASKKFKLVLQKGDKSTLTVQSESGAPADADITKSLLTVLRDELK